MENNFWVIFDTCTRTEYYQDVHNILSLPEGSIIKYNYQKKHIDKLGNDCIKTGNKPINVLLIYGQYEGFKKGDNFKNFKERKTSYFNIPTRLAILKSTQEVNDEIYFDLQLGKYPYPLNKSNIDRIIESLDNSTPFLDSKWVSISSCSNELSFLNEGGNDYDNWAYIIKEFQSKTQFKDDSFWRLDGPYSKSLFSTKNFKHFIRCEENKSNYSSFYDIKQGVEFYFEVYNFEPLDYIKQESIRKYLSAGKKLEEIIHKLIISDNDAPIKSTQKEISLRQYFISKILFQKSYSVEITTKEGLCKFNTSGQLDEWPVGPNFMIYFKVKKIYYYYCYQYY